MKPEDIPPKVTLAIEVLRQWQEENKISELVLKLPEAEPETIPHAFQGDLNCIHDLSEEEIAAMKAIGKYHEWYPDGPGFQTKYLVGDKILDTLTKEKLQILTVPKVATQKYLVARIPDESYPPTYDRTMSCAQLETDRYRQIS